MVIKVINNDVDTALKECRRQFSEIRRRKIRYSYYLRPALRLREKRKIAAVKRKFY
ncbi:ribosomal protein S21 [Mycoplasma haemofelis str. Langford 1]|uniref:Small ribosomal subunit protein bS21 n=2 Tax=Mycoplasma haemofelis TaxID=29501 RepID=F6FIJ0_MYCHI|nr:30S ribosomal protein S21 [Mycoplasma haemofelis]AEG73038.1 30S ribosomal protein S21 [Mycoplasma haemofelis Ohio2]CBY92704.1 ribosomal protein S21 [Mycoplasma haemofelis str. Langford 1]